MKSNLARSCLKLVFYFLFNWGLFWACLIVSKYYITRRWPASICSSPQELLSFTTTHLEGIPARKQNKKIFARKATRKSTTKYLLLPWPSPEAIELKKLNLPGLFAGLLEGWHLVM